MAQKAGLSVNPRPTVIASFKTPFLQGLWDVLANAAKAGEAPPEADSSAGAEATTAENSLFLLGLPAAGDVDQRLLRAIINREGNELTFQMEAKAKPAEPPPSDVVALSNAIGGITGLLNALQDGLADSGTLIGSNYITFGVDKSQWDCPHLGIRTQPITVGIVESSLASAISVDVIGFDLTSGVSGLKKIVIDNGDNTHYSVLCCSSAVLSFSEIDFGLSADGIQSLVTKGFFSLKEVGHVRG